MHRIGLSVLLVFVSAVAAPAQKALTLQQRVADMDQVAGFYAKNYGPYEWKRSVFGFDLLNLAPWQSRIHNADDLDFHEVLIEYVASLNDAHDFIAFPTTFFVSLGLSVDIYDGKVLIDSINRSVLPAVQYPFAIGDELISLDGQTVQTLIQQFRKYAIAGNPRSTDRVAASRIVSRNQQIMPHISSLGNTARLVIFQYATGTTNTYTLPWIKSGIPINSQGPVPSPQPGKSFHPSQGDSSSMQITGTAAAPSLVVLTTNTDNTLPPYMQPMLPLMNASVPTDYYTVLGIGSKFPIYGPPPGFVLRLGALPTDFYLSGTFVSGGLRIGLIRIPSMSPPNTVLALQQLDQEIAYFNANTDGLIVDVMRNPGGTVSFVDSISQRFIPTPFRTLGFEIRATANWLFSKACP